MVLAPPDLPICAHCWTLNRAGRPARSRYSRGCWFTSGSSPRGSPITRRYWRSFRMPPWDFFCPETLHACVSRPSLWWVHGSHPGMGCGLLNGWPGHLPRRGFWWSAVWRRASMLRLTAGRWTVVGKPWRSWPRAWIASIPANTGGWPGIFRPVVLCLPSFARVLYPTAGIFPGAIEPWPACAWPPL